ncbi:uncharacterized protein PRD47_004999 isoform 1-T1 [Ara ararauna]
MVSKTAQLELHRREINKADCFTNCKVEAEDDDTYVVMLGSETQPAMTLKAKQNPGDQYGIDSRCQQEAEVGGEKKDDVEDSRETEHEDQEVQLSQPSRQFVCQHT